MKDGLPQATITCLLQDRSGYVWAGTKDGLARFNGYEFDVIRFNALDSTSLSHSNITCITEDLTGAFWVGTQSGLNRLDPKTLKSERFYAWFEDDKSLSSNHVTAVVCDYFGRIWVATDNGLNLLLPEGGFKTYSIRDNDPQSLSSNKINTLLVDRLNQLWVGTDFGLNLLLDDDSFKRYKYKYQDNNSLSDNAVLCLSEDKEGNLWIGTRNGLNRFHSGLEVFTRYLIDRPIPGLIKANLITALACDFKGQIWVGTTRGLSQLYRKHGGNDGLADIHDFEDVPDRHLTALMVDRSGLIWAGSLSAGVSLLNDDAQRFKTASVGNDAVYQPERNRVYSFCAMEGNLLLTGTSAGVMSYTLYQDGIKARSRWKDAKVEIELDKPVKGMARSETGGVWLATDGMGLLHFDIKTSKITAAYTMVPDNDTGLPSNNLSCIIPADSGAYWLGTYGAGFSYFDARRGIFRTYKFGGDAGQALRDNNVWCLELQDPNNLWIGTGNGGLYHFNVNNSILIPFSGKQSGKGLSSGGINDLHFGEDGTLWVALSGGGLASLSAPSERFAIFDESAGLASNVVLGIQSDFEGNLWLSTNAGISALNIQERTFRNYNEQDIPGYNTYIQGSAFHDADSRLYFGGANGFTYYHTDGLRENRYLPPVVITHFSLLTKEAADDRGPRKLFMGSDTVFLRHDHPGFAVEFAALNYNQAHNNQYAYRLMGQFGDWIYLGTNRRATFTSLAPGNYTLEVKGSNNDGLWGVQQASLYIVIEPAFWQTIYFPVLVVALLFAVFYLLYLWRINTEKRRRLELELAVDMRTREIARERDTNAMLLREIHHRVKNNLQIIVSLLSLQSRYITDRELIKVFDEVQNRVRSMSLIHQKMYQSKDLSTVNIAEYVKDLSSNLLNTYQVGQNVKLDLDVEVNRFKSDTLTPLGLIINEIISNALKHAFTEGTQGTIMVKISAISEKRYRMLIGDDGVGMPSLSDHRIPESLGTELISALTEQLNGNIKRLRNRKGTVYQIEFEDLES